MTFDGTDDYIDISRLNPIFAGNQDSFTIEMWINSPQVSGTNNALLGINGPGASNENQLIMSLTTDMTITINDNVNATASEIESEPLFINTWHHVAYTRDGSVGTLYINGEVAGTHDAEYPIEVGDVWSLGQEFDGISSPGNYYGGLMDEVRIWDIPRSAEEIQGALDITMSGDEPGLVAYYKFDQIDPALTELPDRSQYQYTGVMENFGGAATWTSSGALSLPPGNFALDFDGSIEYVQLPLLPLNPNTDNYTVELWAKADVLSGSQNLIIQEDASGTGRAYLYLTGSTLATLQGGSTIQTGNTTLTTDTWYHFAVTYDGVNVTTYVNGIQEAQSATTPESTMGSFRLGISKTAASPLDGQIDEVRLWNVARSASEITTLMTQKLTGNETGLIAYYPIDDGPGSTIVTDLVGGLNGALVSMEPATDWVEGPVLVPPVFPGLTYISGIDISEETVTPEAVFDVDEDTAPQSVTFNSQGTKMYVVGGSGDGVHQYSLGIPFECFFECDL